MAGANSTSYPDAESRRRSVLVVVMNNGEDFRRAASEGWYRIPQRRAPRRVGADYLAFYQTGAFKGKPEAQTISYFAPTRRYRMVTRREMLPDEADHPRAEDYYFRIEIGPLQRLETPIPSATLRRVTFIHTTLHLLQTAGDVRELFYKEDPFEKLWHSLRENGLRPMKNRIVNEWPVDITLRARAGYLGIRCTHPAESERSAREARLDALPANWQLLSLSLARIEDDLEGCLREIAAALLSLGGSTLNQKIDG